MGSTFSFSRNSALFVVNEFFFERILIPANREVRGEEWDMKT